jgi:tRNA threonylcarbamoyl adenosine modification protein YeaZ
VSRRLALDTAGEEHALVLLDGDALVAGASWPRQRGGGDPPLLTRIASLLAGSGWAVGSLDQVAAGRGPGSFTGVRVGLSVAAGIAYGRGIPLYLVNSLAVLGARDPRPNGTGAMRDAGRGEAFAWRPGEDPGRLAGADLCAFAARSPRLVDEPAGRLTSFCPGVADRVVPPGERLPMAEALRRASISVFENEKPVRYDGLRPLYVQPAAAEERKDPKP